MPPKLLVATRNRGKAAEYAQLLQGLPLSITDLATEGIEVEIDEAGDTYLENATLKAMGYVSASGLITLADDSGLEAEALGGEPGIRSARYGGRASDAERVALLLERLEGLPLEKRHATFRCIIVVAGPSGALAQTHGSVEGLIALEPRGEGGFGYDPVFYLPKLGKTMAELPIDTKNGLSHRGEALRRMRPFLERLAREPSPWLD